MRVVLDTNVLVSGLMLPESRPGKIVAAWHAGQFDLVVSEPLLAEIARVLAYPKIARRLGWDAQQVDRFVTLLRFRTTLADVSQSIVRVPEDPDDDFVLATLVVSRSDWLVSGDEDLLGMAAEYPVLSPAEFVDRFL